MCFRWVLCSGRYLFKYYFRLVLFSFVHQLRVDNHIYFILTFQYILTQERPHEDVKFDRQIEELVLSGARLPIPEDCPNEYASCLIFTLLFITILVSLSHVK